MPDVGNTISLIVFHCVKDVSSFVLTYTTK